MCSRRRRGDRALGERVERPARDALGRGVGQAGGDAEGVLHVVAALDGGHGEQIARIRSVRVGPPWVVWRDKQATPARRK